MRDIDFKKNLAATKYLIIELPFVMYKTLSDPLSQPREAGKYFWLVPAMRDL